MPYRISIDPELNLGAVRVRGSVDLPEFREYRASLEGHESFNRGIRLIVDLREAEFMPTHDEVRTLIASSPFSTDARVAVLVSDDLHFGLARMWSAVGERTSGQLHPFRSVDEALGWLGVPADLGKALLGSV